MAPRSSAIMSAESEVASPGFVDASFDRCTLVEAHNRSSPPRASWTCAVASPAVMVPLLPMLALPFSTESEPERETPSVETYAIGCCCALLGSTTAHAAPSISQSRKRTASELQKILDEPLPIVGQHALGMKLHAFDRILAVAQAHDRPVGGTRGDLQIFGKIFLRDNERVVAGAGHRAGDAGEDGLPVVFDFAGLAVHQLWGANHIAAEGCADGLVAETDAKDRDSIGKSPDEVDADACLLRRAGSGRKQDALRRERLYLVHGELVVAANGHLRAHLSHVLDEVVGEGVVVVENEEHRFSSV